MQSDILIWNKDVGFVKINEGTGDNLLYEDKQEGYIDYINYDFLSYDGDDFSEEDGGMMLLKDLYQDKFHSIPDLIQFMIEQKLIPDKEYIVLYQNGSDGIKE